MADVAYRSEQRQGPPKHSLRGWELCAGRVKIAFVGQPFEFGVIDTFRA